MWSHCYETDAEGRRVLTGPYVTWDEEPSPKGGFRYVLREVMSYREDERHGPHRVYEGPFGREVLVEEEVFAAGSPEGESRSFYLDGTLRELRHYRGGQLDGGRVGYYPDGTERWRVSYEAGRRLAAEGDLSVGGQPCPVFTVPTISADGRQEACARRYLHFLERHGAFLERDGQGRIVERGLYEDDKKVEQWQAPPGGELPAEVSDDLLVAEIELLVGEQPYLEIRTPAPAEDPWASAELQHPDLESLEAELRELEAAAAAQGVREGPAFDIWFRDRGTREYPTARTFVQNGIVRVFGLPPGKYYMKVEVDANPANPEKWPGDLNASVNFEVAAGQVSQARAQLLYTLHLLSPWDNGEPIPGFRYPCSDEAAVIAGPVHFQWRPPATADPRGLEYVYRLARRSCDPLRDLEVMAEGSTGATHLDLDLPPSRAGELYEWSLFARRGERSLGQMMTFGAKGGYGWSLRFRVAPPEP